MTTTNRPTDITLPAGWTWDRVEEQRAKWDISDNMVPIATAMGVCAWGTINSVRIARMHSTARTLAGNDISGI